MASGLAHLKSMRTGHRGVVTRKISDLDVALGVVPIDTDASKQKRAVLQEKLALLQKLSDDIISLLTDEGEIITEVETAELISDSIGKSLLKIQEVIGATETTTPTCPIFQSSMPSAESTPNQN